MKTFTIRGMQRLYKIMNSLSLKFLMSMPPLCPRCSYNSKDQRARYIKETLCQGYPPRFLQQPVFKKFRKTNFYQIIVDSLPAYQGISRKQINLTFYRALDSLYFIDQRRTKVGMPSVRRIEVVREKGRLLQKTRW